MEQRAFLQVLTCFGRVPCGSYMGERAFLQVLTRFWETPCGSYMGECAFLQVFTRFCAVLCTSCCSYMWEDGFEPKIDDSLMFLKTPSQNLGGSKAPKPPTDF